MSLGLRLKRVHRALQFNEKTWLKEYIDFNTEKRKNAKNSFEKDIFKMMNNSVFGKTMENLRKRCNVKLVTDKDKFLRLVGMCILDLSKTLMYDFHYNYIKRKYEDNSIFLFGDTDSLCYAIKTDDIYEDLYKDRDLFDYSDYSKDSKFHFSESKKVIGKFKDEAGQPITEFVGLKSEMYSYTTESKNHKTAKGVKKNIIERDLHHSNYLYCIQNNTMMTHKMKGFRSEYHQVCSYQFNKISLSCYDDKRYIHTGGITSYAYGHYKIN